MSEGRLLYRPQEVARILGLGRTNVYALMARGELSSVKVGAARRIPAADVEQFVQRLRAGADPLEDQKPAAASAE
jgi:excisionase family DNA binding protein